MLDMLQNCIHSNTSILENIYFLFFIFHEHIVEITSRIKINTRQRPEADLIRSLFLILEI